MSNGKFTIGDIARIVKEVATTATELNDSQKQALLHQAKRLESIPQIQGTGEALSKPFPAELRRQRKGHEGKMITYVSTVYYIDRLNEVFNHQWNFELLEHITSDTEVYCHGKLTVEINGVPVVKEAYGGSEIVYINVYDKETRKVIGRKPQMGDALKASQSDSLKKCCSLLGIGGELYREKNQGNQNQGNKTAGGNGKSYDSRTAGARQ